MARFELREDHYLHGHPYDLDEVEWEYKEQDRTTGREKRKHFKVPYYFERETTVWIEGTKGRPQERDGILEAGQITAAMTPLDEEAEAIYRDFMSTFKHPIEGLPAEGFSSEVFLAALQAQLASAVSVPRAPTTVAASGVSRSEFDELLAQMKAMQAQNLALTERLEELSTQPELEDVEAD